MKGLNDCFGILVRLTDERRAHVLEHPEMRVMTDGLEKALQHPQLVRRSRTDPAVRLFSNIMRKP